jgi:hypothetical protein
MRYYTQFVAPWLTPLPTPFPGQVMIFPSDLLPMRNRTRARIRIMLLQAPRLCQVQDFTVRVIMKSDACPVPRITPRVGMGP